MCERAEYYFKQIRSKELRFSENANSVTIYSGKTDRDMPVDAYAAMCMTDYDEEKVEEAEFAINLKNPPFDSEQRRIMRHNAELVALNKFLSARNFLRAIDLAISKNALEEGDAFFRKLEDCNVEKKNLTDERDRLNGELEELSTKYIGLKALYEDCQRKLHIKPLDTKDH